MAKSKVGNMLKKAQTSFLKLNYGALLHNCYVMYFVLFLAIADLLVLTVSKEYFFILIFILVGYLTSFFSKNMMVIMVVAIVATNVLRSGSGVRLNEGLENAENAENAELAERNLENLENEEEKPLEENLENAEEKPLEENLENAELEESKKEKKPKTTESFDLNTKKATSLNSSPIEGLNVLGDQTAQLISTQKKLMENMKTLEPMLTQAEKFMSQFENVESKVSK
jgi:hypothetical protein